MASNKQIISKSVGKEARKQTDGRSSTAVPAERAALPTTTVPQPTTSTMQQKARVDMKDKVAVIMDLVNNGIMDTATALRSITALAELPTTSGRSHTEASVRPTGSLHEKEEAEQQHSGDSEVIADPDTYELRETAGSEPAGKEGGGEMFEKNHADLEGDGLDLVREVGNAGGAEEGKLGSEREGFDVGMNTDEEREWEEAVGGPVPASTPVSKEERRRNEEMMQELAEGMAENVPGARKIDEDMEEVEAEIKAAEEKNREERAQAGEEGAQKSEWSQNYPQVSPPRVELEDVVHISDTDEEAEKKKEATGLGQLVPMGEAMTESDNEEKEEEGRRSEREEKLIELRNDEVRRQSRKRRLIMEEEEDEEDLRNEPVFPQL